MQLMCQHPSGNRNAPQDAFFRLRKLCRPRPVRKLDNSTTAIALRSLNHLPSAPQSVSATARKPNYPGPSIAPPGRPPMPEPDIEAPFPLNIGQLSVPSTKRVSIGLFHFSLPRPDREHKVLCFPDWHGPVSPLQTYSKMSCRSYLNPLGPAETGQVL